MLVDRLLGSRPRRVHVYPPESVTTVSPDEVHASEVGLDPRVIEDVWRSVVAFYETGLHPGIQLCVRCRGAVVLDRAIGHARGNSPSHQALDQPLVSTPSHDLEPLTPSHRMSLFSASKVVAAMLIHLMDERGLLHPDDAVVEYIPEFAAHGKHRVTIRHVLTHRAGIPHLPGQQIDLDMIADDQAILDRLCAAKPLTRPGRQLAYHPITGGYVLGEVLRRVTGKDVRQLVDELIRKPLGFEGFSYGVCPEDVDTVVPNVFTGPLPRRAYAWVLERSLGGTIEEVVRLSNDPRFLTAVVPAGNLIATANETSRFFELLLRDGELDGVRVFPRRAVRRARVEQTYLELDTTIMLPVRYGMGLMLGGKWLSFYGPRTPMAFGHLGFTNVLAWADPERDISVGFLQNGKPFITPRLIRWANVMQTIGDRFPRRSTTRM